MQPIVTAGAEQSPMAFRADIPVFTLFALLILAWGGGLAVAILIRRRIAAQRAAGQVAAKTPYLAEVSWLAAPLVVAGTFAGIAGFDDITTSRDAVVPKPVPVSTRMVGTGAIVPVPTDDRTIVVSDTKLAQRPDWVDQRSVSDGVVERIVLASEQYTTQQEAEQQLSVNATELLLDDLQKLRPGTARPAKWHPADADIRRLMVKQRYVEAIDRDFGNFFHPMYRVWWQVELSPEVRTEFLPGWRHSQTVTRVRRVGIVTASAVLLVSLLAAYRRLDVLTRTARRPMLIGMSGSVIGLWFLGIRFVAERWL